MTFARWPSLFACLTLAGLFCAVSGQADASIVTSPASFTATMTIIDYSSSPVGAIAPGTSVIAQYSTLGVLHDGSTTTPPGPGGMSSFSGLPALESPSGDPDALIPITVTFTTPLTEFGAFFILSTPGAGISLEARRADNSVIEIQTIAAGSLTPGPFGFNEGFIGLILGEPAAFATFSPVLPGALSALAIDDLHFGGPGDVPEPATLVVWSMIGVSGAGLCVWRRAKR
jgi:hypothetical protein